MKSFTKKLVCAAALASAPFSAVLLSAAEGDAYTWPAYSPTCNYNFKAEGIEYTMPEKNYEGSCYNSRAGEAHKDWWSFVWGSNRNSLVSDVSIENLLTHFNEEFNYITDTMGWPRDKRIQDGYRSSVFLYGSMSCTGSNDNTETGGWQTYIDGYPAVNASYYPVYSFDPSCPYSDRESQMSAMIHEGVHCILTTLGASHVHWFQESGNTWLQQEMAVRRGGEYSGMGFLNAVPLICPFMPIECYSGWLLDGSFGGPGAQGVGSNPTCNWRTTLGGSQYSNIFPTFLGLWISEGAVPWIWVNTTNSSKYILETMGDHMGDAQIRRLIMEYRAKMAMLDMKGRSAEMRNLINQNFGYSLGCECSSWSGWSCSQSADAWVCTPYVETTLSGTTLTPESTTTPGWSGANFIPLNCSGKGSTVKVGFTQIGDNMTLQLCYRGTDGVPVYSEPVYGDGTAVLNITTEPQDNIVMAVVCNTDYAYKGEETRTKHHDYRLTLESGVTSAADPHTAWYNNFVLTYDWNSVSNTAKIEDAEASSSSSASQSTLPTDTLVYNVSLPVGTNYSSVSVSLDADKIAGYLGLTSSALSSGVGSSVNFYGVNLNGGLYTTYTANNGYWFASNGNVCSWSDSNSRIFAELTASSMSVNIGQYADSVSRVSAGDNYKVTTCFQTTDHQVNVVFNISVTNSDGSSANTDDAYDVQTLTYNVSLPVGTDYKSTNIAVDADKLAEMLGVQVSVIKSDLGNSVKFYGVNPDSSVYMAYTANTGYWFTSTGTVCEWSNSDSKIFAELNTTDLSVNVGQYATSDAGSSRVAVGETYKVVECFRYDNKQVNLVFNITITDEDDSAVHSPFVYENSRQRQLTTWYENGVVVANYTIPYDGDAKLSIYSPTGALLEHLVNGQVDAGNYRYDIDFKAMGYPAGIYLIKLYYPGYSETKMVVAQP